MLTLPPQWPSIASAFAAQVAATPRAVALFAPSRQVSYADLDALSTTFARGLARRGVAPGDRIGIALDRSIELVAVMLAVFRLGAVVVPIDPAWPRDRRTKVSADAVLTWTVASVSDGPRVLALGALSTESSDVVDVDVRPDAIALALYTSGSTGDPKAALISHHALLWRFGALSRAMPYEPDDVACQRTPPTFIDAYAEVLMPLLHGVPTCVLPHPLAIHELVHALEVDRVTRLWLVPSVLALLLDASPDLGARAAGLRIVLVGGEALSPQLARRFYAAAPAARLINIYGSTEVAGDATFAEIPKAVPDVIPIGHALEGVTVCLLDERGVRIANGGPGELAVFGPVLAAGYWNRPELSAARFVRDSATGATMFRTGDLAQYLPDGQLRLVGRLDDQVKIGGVRVELGEVEQALRGHTSVRAAAVARHDTDGRTRLVAGIVGEGDIATIRAQLIEQLPSAAIPSVFAWLPALPTNSHGKVDRRALAAAVLAATATSVEPAADALTARVAGWFAQLTGRPAGATDEFEAIGGDSLARLGLLVKLEREGFHFDHADLPRPLTPDALAACMRVREVVPTSESVVAAGDEFPVTDFQRVMVLESLANAGTPMWCDQVSFGLDGAIDHARFECAWRDMVAAEPALRTTFVWRDRDEPCQVVHAVVDAPVARIDLRHVDLESYRLRVLAEEWKRISLSFALDAAPLFEACLLLGPDCRNDLIFTYHHAILDGDSARRFLRAVLARYAGRDVPPPREPFRNFVARTGARSAAHDRWREMFAGYRHVDEPEPPAATQLGDFVWRTFHRLLALRRAVARARMRRRVRRLRRLLTAANLSPAVYAGGDINTQPIAAALDREVAAWARTHRTTPMAVWVAAFALHLARERRTPDVAFGVIVAGRDGRSAETIGMLANCLPLRVQIDEAESVAKLVADVGRHLDDLERDGQTPLLALAAAIGLDPRVLLDTQFVSWRFSMREDATPSGELRAHRGRSITLTAPRTALILSASNDGGELAVGARSFHRTDRIRRDVLSLVEAIVTAPDGTLGRVLLSHRAHEGGITVAVSDLA